MSLELGEPLGTVVVGHHLNVQLHQLLLRITTILLPCLALKLVAHLELLLLSREILIHELLGLDRLLLLHDPRVDGALLLLRVDKLCVGVRLRMKTLRDTHEFLTADGLLELAQPLLRVLIHKVGHTILRQKLTQIIQIDLQRPPQLLQLFLLCRLSVDEEVRSSMPNPHLHEDITPFPTQQHLRTESGKELTTFTRASLSPYLMNSSSFVPLNSSFGSSPSAKHTAQAIVLYTHYDSLLLLPPFPRRSGQE